MKKHSYGLVTAITMITGIVIGSGIFFKSDDVLAYTQGNVLLGIGIFVVAAIAIVFGSLTMSQLATRTDKPGGIVTYAEEFVGVRTASMFGWFYTLLYTPALTAVVSWVSGIYICQLFGWEGSVGTWTLIGGIMMTAIYVLNFSPKLGGWWQNASMFIKLIPLILLAVAGFLFGDPGATLSAGVNTMSASISSFGWVAAFGPIAFSFDGWIVSTSICHEIKDSKRNLPLALSVAPLAVLIIYVAYFVGITSLVGVDEVLALGDGSVNAAANILFGEIGAKAILVFVTISVIGTVNGLVLAMIRLPYSLAIRSWIPASKWIKKDTGKSIGEVPFNSAILSFAICLFWLIVNQVTQTGLMSGSGDISEIAICVSYLNYIVLYVAVIKLAKRGEIKSVWIGYVVPVLATVGSLIILSGSIAHPFFVYYIIISAIVMGAGFWYGDRQQKLENRV